MTTTSTAKMMTTTSTASAIVRKTNYPEDVTTSGNRNFFSRFIFSKAKSELEPFFHTNIHM